MTELRIAFERWLNLSRRCYELHFLSFFYRAIGCVHPIPPVHRTSFIARSVQMWTRPVEEELLKRCNDITATRHNKKVKPSVETKRKKVSNDANNNNRKTVTVHYFVTHEVNLESRAYPNDFVSSCASSRSPVATLIECSENISSK